MHAPSHLFFLGLYATILVHLHRMGGTRPFFTNETKVNSCMPPPTCSSWGSAFTCRHSLLMASLPIFSLWQTDSRIDLTWDASSLPRIGDAGGEGTAGRQRERKRENCVNLFVFSVNHTNFYNNKYTIYRLVCLLPFGRGLGSIFGNMVDSITLCTCVFSDQLPHQVSLTAWLNLLL